MAHAKGPNPWDQDESTADTYAVNAAQDESTGEGVAAAGNLTGLTGKLLHPIKPTEWFA